MAHSTQTMARFHEPVKLANVIRRQISFSLGHLGTWRCVYFCYEEHGSVLHGFRGMLKFEGEIPTLFQNRKWTLKAVFCTNFFHCGLSLLFKYPKMS